VDPPGAGIYYVGYGKTTETFNFGNNLEKLEDEDEEFNPVNGSGKQKLKQVRQFLLLICCCILFIRFNVQRGWNSIRQINNFRF
jgi:hypothetical protein